MSQPQDPKLQRLIAEGNILNFLGLDKFGSKPGMMGNIPRPIEEPVGMGPLNPEKYDIPAYSPPQNEREALRSKINSRISGKGTVPGALGKVNPPPRVSEDMSPLERLLLMGDTDITGNVKEQSKVVEPEKDFNLKPLLALIDTWTGSRLAQSYEDPNIAKQRQFAHRQKASQDAKNDQMNMLYKLQNLNLREQSNRLREKDIERKENYGNELLEIKKLIENRKGSKPTFSEKDHMRNRAKFRTAFRFDLDHIAASQGMTAEEVNQMFYEAAKSKFESDGTPIDQTYSKLVSQNLVKEQ